MIWMESFLSIPLRTRRQRRIFLFGYTVVALAIPVFGMVRHRPLNFAAGLVLFQLVMLTGGFAANGPVRPFGPNRFGPDGTGAKSWFLEGLNEPTGGWDGKQEPDPRTVWNGPDERELRERDRAHYLAYRALRWGIFCGGLIGYVAWHWGRGWLLAEWPYLLWIVLFFVYVLPQYVILWTEPSALAEAADEAVA